MDVFKYFGYAAKKGWSLTSSSLIRLLCAHKNGRSARRKIIKPAEGNDRHHCKNGIIIASTNSSAFNMKKFKGFIETAFKETNERYDILEEYTLPEDFKTIPAFKEGNYLKVVFLRKK